MLAPFYGIAAANRVLKQCCMDYPGIPDVRTLTLAQLQDFYNDVAPNIIKSMKG